MMDNSCWAWNSIWRLIVRRLSASAITHNIPQSPTCFPPTHILWSLHAPYIFSRIALHRVQESFSWSSSASAFIHCRKPHSYKEEDYHSILGIAHRERDILSASLCQLCHFSYDFPSISSRDNRNCLQKFHLKYIFFLAEFYVFYWRILLNVSWWQYKK